ncbi:MAG: peptide MFS transporter [Myxococcaceae bacterium]|nr:peptide MFS transporter [Myxococcaceae bacterium]
MSVAATGDQYLSDKYKSHPPGLYMLFTTEMWERMSYYGMRALLTLYMAAATINGGFGWTQKETLQIYGIYTGLVYVTPLLGGWVADKFWGQRKAVIVGGSLMMIGHFLMAVPGKVAFFSALGFLILGNGFFKPNISTMVGGLYRPGDARRDGAFTIFYMGINLGALLGGLICGTLGEVVGWHWGFASAGVGMGLGLIAFLTLQKRLLGDTVGMAPKPRVVKDEGPRQPLTKEEISRILVILILAVFVMTFWAAFEQAGGLLNLYAKNKVDRSLGGWEMPATQFQNLNPLFIFLLGPLFSMIWTYLGRTGKDPSIPVKMAMGILFCAAGFVVMLGAAKITDGGGKAGMWWLVATYFLHTVGELCLSPVGLSMVTKLAPVRYVSLLMGTWFLIGNAFANYLAGYIGGFAEELGEYQIFGGLVVVLTASAVLLLALSPVLKKMMHGADAINHEAPNKKPALGNATAEAA